MITTIKREFNVAATGYSYRDSSGRYVAAWRFACQVYRQKIEACARAIKAAQTIRRTMNAELHIGDRTDGKIRTRPLAARERAQRTAELLFGAPTRG